MTTRQRNNEMISTVAGGVITHVKDDARADTAGWKVWKIVILKWKKKRRNCFGGGRHRFIDIPEDGRAQAA